mgnify:CR=1 FL=1
MVEAARETAALFAAPVARAKAAGLVRDDASVDDILVACNMIGSAQGSDFSTGESVFEQGFALMIKGIGGPEYINAILTGYTGETKEEAGETFYENHAFAGGWISMGPPLSDDQVTYADGTPATLSQMSEDVASFLMWAAEPHMMARKQTGFVAVIFLVLLTSLLYLTNKRLWAGVKGKKHA